MWYFDDGFEVIGLDSASKHKLSTTFAKKKLSI